MRSLSVGEKQSQESSVLLFFFARRRRALAAALEAFVALSLRCFAVNDLARASPPRLPISIIASLNCALSIVGNVTP
jgi:hypothetical protein